MKLKPTQKKFQEDLFRSRLEKIINLRHELLKLGDSIHWDFLES